MQADCDKQITPIVYLDVDGVLNNGGIATLRSVQDQRVLVLKGLVNRTGAEIIVSSYWRTMPPLRTKITRALNRHGMRVAGWTKQPGTIAKERWQEIQGHFKSLPHARPFVVLDDNPQVGQLKANWVIVRNGLTINDVLKAEKIIKRDRK